MMFTKDYTRRDALRIGSLAAIGAAGASMLSGCAPSSSGSNASAARQMAEADACPSFLKQPEAITDFAETKEYDVVVVGAGAAGVAAAIKAKQEGASVALIQKESVASSQGFAAAGLDLDKNDKATQEAVVSYMMANSEYRPDRSLLRAWVSNSGEAVKWYRDILHEADVEDNPSSKTESTVLCNGREAVFARAVPSTTFVEAINDVAEYAQEQGVEIFYDTPGVQLVKEGDAVVGVVGGSEEAYICFKANRGVILATGDYQCNDEMIAFYCPDVLGFPPLTIGHDGDGHKMGVWAGGQIEPVGHTKMIHDLWMNASPYLIVDPEGGRITDEHMPWWMLNTLMRSIVRDHAGDYDAACLWSVMDSNYMSQAEEWQKHDASITPKEVPAVEGYTFAADTIEELAGMIGVDADSLSKTVERYNELVALGADEDFGKEPQYLAPIEEPPFYAVMRDFNYGLSAILGGLIVNGENRVLDEAGEPIPGLFAVGNASGPFFGGVDYPMEIGGLSVGRAITTGYVAGRVAAQS